MLRLTCIEEPGPAEAVFQGTGIRPKERERTPPLMFYQLQGWAPVWAFQSWSI